MRFAVVSALAAATAVGCGSSDLQPIREPASDAAITLADLTGGSARRYLDGRLEARRVPSTAPLAGGPLEQDFPAAAADGVTNSATSPATSLSTAASYDGPGREPDPSPGPCRSAPERGPGESDPSDRPSG